MESIHRGSSKGEAEVDGLGHDALLPHCRLTL